MELQLVRQYGSEHFGRLRLAMLHSPQVALRRLNQITAGYYLYDAVPDADRYLAEHAAYRRLLELSGVEVLELADYVRRTGGLMDTLPSLPYLHDIAVITGNGAILSRMGGGRMGEESVVKEALGNLGIPLFYEFAPADHFEGCLPLSPQTLLIVNTERHRRQSIENFVPRALTLFDEVLYVDAPAARRFMHADMIYGQVSETLALAFPPAFLGSWRITRGGRTAIDFVEFMNMRGVEIIAVSDGEQRKWACSFVPLSPGAIVHYDIALSAATRRKLEGRGADIIDFHPDALLAGGGSLRCLTLQIWRAEK